MHPNDQKPIKSIRPRLTVIITINIFIRTEMINKQANKQIRIQIRKSAAVEKKHVQLTEQEA